jgi:hypothetical protein
MGQIFDGAPRRTTPILLMDANASFPATVPADGDEEMGMRAIGPSTFGRLSWQARQIRDFWQERGLAAANTFTSEARPTFFGPRGRSIIDYIVLPWSSLGSVSYCMPWLHAGLLLQTSPASKLCDHVPIMLHFWHADWTPILESEARLHWDRQALRRATATGEGVVQYSDNIERAIADPVRQCHMEAAAERYDVEGILGCLQDSVNEAGDIFQGWP